MGGGRDGRWRDGRRRGGGDGVGGGEGMSKEGAGVCYD